MENRYQIGFADNFTYGDEVIKYEITTDNTIQLYVEDCARALGVTDSKKLKGGSISTTVRWNRVYDDLVGIEKIANLGDFKALSKDMKSNIRNTMKALTISETELYLWSFRIDSEQGKKFRDWLAKIVLPNLREHGIYVTGMENMNAEQVKRITNERIESYVLRKWGVGVRRCLTDTIQKMIQPETYESWKYGTYTNIVYIVLFGYECKPYKELLGLDEKDSLRDYMSENGMDEDINMIAKAEDFMSSLIMSGITDVNMLTNLMTNWYKNIVAA
jgi:prophage antirepressor-like protein